LPGDGAAWKAEWGVQEFDLTWEKAIVAGIADGDKAVLAHIREQLQMLGENFVGGHCAQERQGDK
jgi:hypothetical protein